MPSPWPSATTSSAKVPKPIGSPWSGPPSLPTGGSTPRASPCGYYCAPNIPSRSTLRIAPTKSRPRQRTDLVYNSPIEIPDVGAQLKGTWRQIMFSQARMACSLLPIAAPSSAWVHGSFAPYFWAQDSCASPIAFRMPLHHPRAVAGHELASLPFYVTLCKFLCNFMQSNWFHAIR